MLYTAKDLVLLGSFLNQDIYGSDLKRRDPRCFKHICRELLKDYLKISEKKTPAILDKVLYELIGPYYYGYTEDLDEFLDLKKTDMPLYIEDKIPWKRVIAKWRLKINK